MCLTNVSKIEHPKRQICPSPLNKKTWLREVFHSGSQQNGYFLSRVLQIFWKSCFVQLVPQFFNRLQKTFSRTRSKTNIFFYQGLMSVIFVITIITTAFVRAATFTTFERILTKVWKDRKRKNVFLMAGFARLLLSKTTTTTTTTATISTTTTTSNTSNKQTNK